MPVQTTYPGVYVQEVASGVRTIAGVSTSVTAFAGSAKRGPINRAVQITSYADFERRFGGLARNSEMSYAVKQFFLNGGSQAIIIRLAADAVVASARLQNDATPRVDVLEVTALDQGAEGNRIEVRVNYQTDSPDSTFNLVVNYASPENPADNRSETFTNLSMNSSHPNYVERIVRPGSNLVTVTRLASPAGLGAGTALSGELVNAGTPVDVGTLVDSTHNQLRIAVNGLDPVTVQLPDVLGGATPALRLDNLCAAIETSVVNQANGEAALSGFTCGPAPAPDTNRILMTSGESGENSRVEVLPGLRNDVTGLLRLRLSTGGRQIDAVAPIRPREVPDPATLTGANLANADIPGAAPAAGTTLRYFNLSLDGGPAGLVDIGAAALPAAGNIADRLGAIATRMQAAVRALRPTSPPYRDFTCRVVEADPADPNARRLQLSPGSRGSGSSVVVTAAPNDVLADRFKLLIGTAVQVQPTNLMLQGGSETDITPANLFVSYVGSRDARTGIYALEGVDLFNIMCLPGVTDGGVLMESEAYCRERRAFLVVDAPQRAAAAETPTSPADMVTLLAGADLPKSDHAAVYYPWIKISDPLDGGRLRESAPSGTIAGLYARIDANRGVWKAPAGTEATLTGVRGVTYSLTDRENGILNPLGINCLRIFTDAGPVCWGSRTLAGSDRLASEWKYIPVRRTALFIEESLYRGLKWVVFEPNDEPLWAQIRLNVGAFMHNLFRQGAFQGQKRDDAYFVKCDRDTTTQNDINLGIVNIQVGFAPLKPAEFVVLYLQQMTGQIQV